jgi:hypothetical protein
MDASRAHLFIATSGDDTNPGTQAQPFATFEGARDAVRALAKRSKKAITVSVREGTYYLREPLVFGPEDSGSSAAPITYVACPHGSVTISGGRRLDCRWRPFRDGMMMCELLDVESGELSFTQVFVNGKRQIRARYPNYDPSEPGVSGYIQAAGRLPDDLRDPCPGPNDDMAFSSGAARGVLFDPATFTKKSWDSPKDAVIHIYQSGYWGNLQWRVKALDYDSNIIWFGHGGQQMGAKWFSKPCDVNQWSRFYVENVLEELDAPGEWYLDRREGVLYYLPPEHLDLENATVEVPVLQQAVRFLGTQDEPVHDVTFSGFRFAHTASTFLEEYSVPSLSDWAIHRGGTVFLQGAHDCRIENCWFDAVGGNGVFVNNHNRGIVITGCKFTEAGDSAVCFVGSLELTNGTQRSFPYECQATNNLTHDCGVFGKQIAGVYISRAKRITAGHNLMYNMPRAGICIGDGTWGGHVIEYNHIHDTCRETGDHGPFNAWGRDKYWCLVQSHTEYLNDRSHYAGEVLIDAMEPVIVRHNFFEEKAGWGLDLDDGASNYDIYNNLCVGVSMKLREGAYRTIYNNIWVNGANSPCFHVGNEDNHDRYVRNITVMSVAGMRAEHDLNFQMGKGYGEIYTLIAPPARGPWLEEIDHNCFYSDLGEFVARVTLREGERRRYSLEDWRQVGFDVHSVFADPMFIDPGNNDYRVKPDSPALEVGFENFEMGRWGLTDEFPERLRD